jgi:hypothetical protein
MNVREYYNQILSRNRRSTPTYSEASRDLNAALRDQWSVLTRGV